MKTTLPDELDGMFSHLTQRLANSVARKHGYGRATKITFNPAARQPCIGDAQNCGWETRGGTPIRYPNAYRKVGRSNMVQIHAHCEVILPKDTEILVSLLTKR
jgi:hypothetical protein